jgi:hypothetical protein
MMIQCWQAIGAMETVRRQIDQMFNEFKDSSSDRSQPWIFI